MTFINPYRFAAAAPTFKWLSARSTGAVALSNGDLTATSSGTDQQTGADTLPTGKVYWEVSYDTDGGSGLSYVGLCRIAYNTSLAPSLFFNDPGSVGYNNGGYVFGGGALQQTYATFAAGDIIMVARDRTSGKVWFGKNGVWNGDPAAGTGEAMAINVVHDMYAALILRNSGDIMTLVPDAASQTYTAPSGFTAIG